MNYLKILKSLYLGEISKHCVYLTILRDKRCKTNLQAKHIKSALLGCMNGISPIDVDIRIKEILNGI